MSDVDYIALAFEPHGNVTMRQLRRAALREREAKAALAARLAEVEAENAELVEKLKAGLSRNDRMSLSSLFGYDLGVEEGRAEGQAERDRLAQELEDKSHESAQYHASYVDAADRMFMFKAERDEAIGHLRAAYFRQGPITPGRPCRCGEIQPCHYCPSAVREKREAREFLARFPREGDGDDS